MEIETPVRLWTPALEGLVTVNPKVSGVPFWVWAWAGGIMKDAAPVVLVTPGPSLRDRRVARVAVYPEVAVLDGPAIEVDEEFEHLAAWIEVNRGTIAGYWFQLGPTRPHDFLAQIRPVPQAMLSQSELTFANGQCGGGIPSGRG